MVSLSEKSVNKEYILKQAIQTSILILKNRIPIRSPSAFLIGIHRIVFVRNPEPSSTLI